MTAKFDMKKVTTPLLLHMLGQELPFSRVFLLLRKLTLSRFKKTIDPRFPRELVDLAALPAWVYLNLREKIGQRKAFEIIWLNGTRWKSLNAPAGGLKSR